MSDISPIPEHYPRVCPYLLIDGATEALEFYVRVLDARERYRLPAPDGTIGHAEIEIGSSVIMLADMPATAGCDPTALGGTPVLICVYVEDVDTVFDRAIEAGATSIESVQNKFYGDRSGTFEDPWGHRWSVMTHVEDVSADEMERRAAKEAGQ